MSLTYKLAALALLTLALLATAGPAFAERTLYLGLCQELVSNARAYEARANYHKQVAKNLTVQIENHSRLVKNSGTIAAIDSLFQQYEENRALEQKFRQLQRKSSDEADRCMKSAE